MTLELRVSCKVLHIEYKHTHNRQHFSLGITVHSASKMFLHACVYLFVCLFIALSGALPAVRYTLEGPGALMGSEKVRFGPIFCSVGL